MQSLEKTVNYMDTLADCGYFNGAVLVAYKGEVILRKGYGFANLEYDIPNRPETKFLIASLTKAFTAMLILQLEERGMLSVEDPIIKYLHDYPNGYRIKIHHLLSHSSGIPNYTSFPDFFHRMMRLHHSMEKLIGTFKDKELRFQPGEKNGYSNSGYILLTVIIEKVTGLPYEDVLQNFILKPLGMKNTGYNDGRKVIKNLASGYHIYKSFVHPEPQDMSITRGAFGLYSTIDDLYQWDRALTTEILVSKHSLEKMFTPYYPRYGGYGWDIKNVMLNEAERKRIAHFGDVDGFVNYFARYVDDDLTTIVLSNTTIAPVEAISSNLAKIVLGEEVALPIKRIGIKLKSNEVFVGNYTVSEGQNGKILITLEEGELYISPHKDDNAFKYPIFPVSKEKGKTIFVSKFIEEEIHFITGLNGTVVSLTYVDHTGNSVIGYRE